MPMESSTKLRVHIFVVSDLVFTGTWLPET